jgi:integrase
MTSLSLKQVVERALADVGANPCIARKPKGKARTTTWLRVEHGFGIRHYPSGRHVYIVQLRMAGRMRTVTIGPASVLTRHQAMMVARRVIAHVRVGNDPATKKQQVRNAPNMDDFIAEYWEKCSPNWKPSTVKTTSDYRRCHIDGAFPDAFVDSLTEAEVAKWFVAVTDRSGPGAANRCLEILRAAFNRAESWGYRVENSNPCVSVRQNKRNHRTRFLSTDELTSLGGLLANARESEDRMEKVNATAIALLILTGCRVSEVLGLQWSDVKGNRLLLRDSKTGPRTVWLGDEARDLIQALPRASNNPWLFWNWRFHKPLKTITHIWDHYRRELNFKDVRLHDLRHTFASHAVMGKENLQMIGRLLGHANVKSTARYAHFDDVHLLDAAEIIGASIERAMLTGSHTSKLQHPMQHDIS